jgi:hypothetical protein
MATTSRIQLDLYFSTEMMFKLKKLMFVYSEIEL